MQNCEDLHKKSMDENIDKRLVYDNWASSYDEYVKSLNYTGPKEIVNKLITYLENTNEKQNILDFGSGTGLVGEELIKHNFNILLDGIDVSDKMIEIAESKKIYNNIYNINLHTKDFKQDTKYNFIVSSGVFLEGHVNFNVIDKLHNILEKDGLILVTIRNSYKDKNKETFDSYFKNNSKFKSAFVNKIDYLKDVECSLVVLHN
jgi:predicted TPR repeat methyltransferase